MLHRPGQALDSLVDAAEAGVKVRRRQPVGVGQHGADRRTPQPEERHLVFAGTNAWGYLTAGTTMILSPPENAPNSLICGVDDHLYPMVPSMIK